MSRTMACVVAYNRAALLQTVLASLTSQLEAYDILVVDNASTDHTKSVVDSFSGVRYFNTRENLGGAGGFAWAIELAIALGYERAYLLDDDAIPASDAIEVLNAAAMDLFSDPSFAYLVSMPVARSANFAPVGIPHLMRGGDHATRSEKAGGVRVDHAAFLGILINLGIARNELLPFMEFFIWCDDVEYTTRLAHVRGAACIPQSTIQHESSAMQASATRQTLGWKYFYAVRNRLWLARWGLPRRSVRARWASVAIALRATRNELLANGVRAISPTLRAWSSGLISPRPIGRHPGSLLANSADATNWLIGQRHST